MNSPLCAVLLAGRIRPSPLSQALGVPVLCLPVGPHGSLLNAWLDALAPLEGLQSIKAVVNALDEVEAVKGDAAASRFRRAADPCVRIIAEPAAWRGAGGILRDVCGDASDDSIVLVCEAKRLPPASLAPIVNALAQADDSVAGVVGVCGKDEPSGICAFRRNAIEQVPTIGYFDIKEQFLPALARLGHTILTIKIDESVSRIRDLESYLETVRKSLQGILPTASDGLLRISDKALISPSALLNGFGVIEAGAAIEDGAVVHDSVVLSNAVIGGGCVVTRSVIGPGARLQPRSRVVRGLVGRNDAGIHRFQTNRFEPALEARLLW